MASSKEIESAFLGPNEDFDVIAMLGEWARREFLLKSMLVLSTKESKREAYRADS